MPQRPYRSPLRERRAEETREAVLRAARECFVSAGFRATTVTQIARQAGVSEPTIYAAFGSKAALVRAMLDQIETIAESQARPWKPEAAEEHLEAWLAGHGRIFDTARDLLRVGQEARREPDVAPFFDEGDRRRRYALTDVVTRLAGSGRLRSGLTQTYAVDQAWAVSSVSVYLNLVDDCGWSHDEYVAWLRAAVRLLLLDDD